MRLLRHTVLVIAFALAGCADAPAEVDAEPAGEPPAGAGAETEPTAPADDVTEPAEAVEADRPAIVLGATLPPIASLVEHVAGARAEVRSLVPSGVDSHTYEPTPADVRFLTDAAAYFGVGLDLNEAALRLAEQTLPEDAPVVRLAEVVVPDDEVVYDHVHGEDGDHSHGGHSHDDDGHSHDDGTAEAGANAHVWLDVRYAIGFVEEIRDVLVEADPDAAVSYRSNAAETLDRLRALDEAVAAAVASIPAGRRTMVVYHDAWTYFGGRYGVEVIAAIQPSDFSEPSATDVRRMIDQIRHEDVPAVFGSEVFPSPVLDAIAEETGAEYVGTLADDQLPGAPGDPAHSYEGLMVDNVTAIVQALGGDPAPVTDQDLLPERSVGR